MTTPNTTQAPTPQPLHLTLSAGLTLHGLRWAPPSAQPPTHRALALHGWLDNAASFTRLAPLLATHGVEVVALDLPGHGLSDHRPPSARYHFIDLPADMLLALDALGWPHAALIGHSMGAGVAAFMAALAPSRASHLVMLDGLGPLTTDPVNTLATAHQHLSESSRARPPSASPDLSSLATRRAQAFGASLSHDSALLLVTRGSLPTPDGHWRQRHDPRLRTASLLRLSEAHVQSFFAGITCPTLVVRALDGWPLPDDAIQTRLRYFTHTQPTLAHIPGGHHAHLEDPSPLLPLLLSHLNLPTSSHPEPPQSSQDHTK